jgi:Fuc2NAc and GlcNAc transferase
LLDQPNARSSHCHPTPRGGGLAFVVVSSVSSGMALLSGQGFAAPALPLIAAPLAVVGLLDDRHNLPASWRYGVQLLTAALVLGFSPLVQRFGLAVSSGSLLLLPVLALLVIAVTAVINFTNFMDGLDGLVAGCMAVTIAALAIALAAPWPLWALVGSLLGFLLWNWSPAKVFMGDVGSTFLGAVFAGLVLQASSWPEALGCLLVATPLLGDACLCVPRRLLAGQRVFQAHRLHLFQRLNQAGWSHARVSLTYIAGTAVLAVAMLAGGWPWVFGLAVVELLVGVWLDQRVAVPFSFASQS